MPDKKRKMHGDDPMLLARKPSKGERHVEIDGEQWAWRHGVHNVVIRSPSGVSTVVPLLNKDQTHNVEIGHVSSGGSFIVRPSDVKHYVSKHLRKK